MHPTYEFTGVLIIRHPNVDPAVLTQELGLTAEYSWRAGDSRPADSGSASGGVYRESYWAAKFHPYPGSSPGPTLDALFEAFGLPTVGTPVVVQALPLESALALGTLILTRRRKFWERLRSEGASAEFLISLASTDRVNLKLPADLLATMASLGVSMCVDMASCVRAAAA